MKKNRATDAMGLRLPRQALRILNERGIFAQPAVSLQHQRLASRYVIRGVESGGAAGDVGRYVTFAQEDGKPMEYLHPVEAIGVNGLHAVVLAPVLVRLDMLRKGRTYELLISQHTPGKADTGRRPPLESKVLFRGVHGRLELDLAGKDKAQAGRGVANLLFTGRGRNRHPGAIPAGDSRHHQSRELRGLFPLPLRLRTTQRPCRENSIGKRGVASRCVSRNAWRANECGNEHRPSGEAMPLVEVA